MKLTSLERESIFVFNQAEQNASIFTCKSSFPGSMPLYTQNCGKFSECV